MVCQERIDLYAYFGRKRPNPECQGYINAYIMDQYPEYMGNRLRPAMIVFPGGGYHFCSQRECQPIAINYMARGFQAFTVEYTTRNHGGEEAARYPLIQIEAAMAVAYVRENADKFHVRPDRIAVIGFSAGGHLAGTICTMYDDAPIVEALGEKAALCRPDGGVLSYAVLSFDTPTHAGTRDQLSGGDSSLWKHLSVKYHVNENTPPLFLWANANDTAVPPTNTMEVASAMFEKRRPFEVHIYDAGGHGISLADIETSRLGTPQMNIPYIAEWVDDSVAFLRRRDFLPVNAE